MIIRPFTFLTGLAFIFSGAYLFVVKHQSQGLEDKMGQLALVSRADEQAVRVLKAQWALEADPSRIASLAAEFTQLKPMQPAQLITLASLAGDLPAPGSAAPYNNPEDVVPDMPEGAGGSSAPSGPAIQVSGHQVADATQASSQQRVADNQTGSSASPTPAPVAPASFRSDSNRQPTIHLASAERVSRSWVAPIARQERSLHQERDIHRASRIPAEMPPYVIQTRAEAVVPAPNQPLGAQIVRIKAVSHQSLPVVQHDLASELPMGGGSLLGMAQSGSQN